MPYEMDTIDSGMSSTDWSALIDESDLLLRRIFPICRSITGNGVRETLSVLQGVTEFDIHEIPSGTKCHDWTIPDEWNIRDAYILDSAGNKIVDFQVNNVHLVSYSEPIDQKMSFDELVNHLHSLPDLPQAIPYRTTYYQRDWGFCISHDQLMTMDKDSEYYVHIDSTLAPGSMTLGDYYIEGDSGQEFLISTYCCHPSLGNDNISGQVLWTLLLRYMKSRKTNHSYRFVIAPETIGANVYMSQHERELQNLSGGLVITTVAGPGQISYKQSFRTNAIVDRIVKQTFREEGIDYQPYPFDIRGSDERQYSSPQYRIPIGTICKDKYYEYESYHTSLDNLDFIGAENLVETFKVYADTIANLDMNQVYRSLNPRGEPMLSKRGLYPTIGGQAPEKKSLNHSMRGNLTPEDMSHLISGDTSIDEADVNAMLWVMFYSDGKDSILDISEKTGIRISQLYRGAQMLLDRGLLEFVKEV